MTDQIEDTPLTPDEERDALAAELALGLLEGEELQTAVARLSSDAEFAQAYRGWQERLCGMGENLTAVMPPARAWHIICERLGHTKAPLTEDPTDPLPWWRGPKGWFAGLVAVAALATILLMPGQLPVSDAAPDYQAQLVSEDETLQVIARLEGRDMEVALEQGSANEGRDLEIWWIKPDGSAPISLGLVPRSGSTRMELPEGVEPDSGIKIALSDEPSGGSPTGEATGPIVAIADLTSL